MSSVPYLNSVMKTGFAVLALLLFAINGQAQNAYHGKFTLPYEVYWGPAILLAGDCTVALESHRSPYTLYIRGEKASAIISALWADTGFLASPARLNLVDISHLRAIKTFEAPELGVTFNYATPKQKILTFKQGRRRPPQAEPGPQVGENKMSIVVRPSVR